MLLDLFDLHTIRRLQLDLRPSDDPALRV